jgi:hypothetical protein
MGPQAHGGLMPFLQIFSSFHPLIKEGNGTASTVLPSPSDPALRPS